jgi:hypothetical protein
MEDKRFDVEAVMNQFVIESGGNLVSHVVSERIQSLNADYVFFRKNIISELKCFQKDLFSQEDDADRLNNLIDKWMQEGWFDNNKKVKKMLKSGYWHPELVEQFLKMARKSIDATIHKGNKQIGETKKLLDLPNARGLLFLCNDGNYFLPPHQFMDTIMDIITNKYLDSNIDCFIFFTINQLAYLPSEGGAQMWYPFFKNDEIKDGDFGMFAEELRLSFFNSYMPKLVGGPRELVKSDEDFDIEYIRKLKYVPKKI